MSESMASENVPSVREQGQHDGLTCPDDEDGVRFVTYTHYPRPSVAHSFRVDNAQNDDRRRSNPSGVMLTGYRLFSTIAIVGIGIPKAVYSYHGQSLVSPSLDWVGGIIFALL